MIKFENVFKRYGKVTVIDNLNLEIKQGEFVVLIGPSGCGKTTTLKMINRLIKPNSGKIFINDEDISKVNPVALRRTIGYVIQQIGLFPNMTVEQNISAVPKLLKYPKQKCKEIVRELLELANMSCEENAHKYPSELSGGQQQRVGVLRALAASPSIVLMDEPFGALDPITRETLQEEVKSIQKKLNKTIVLVTHDMDEALRLADTIIFMNEGKVVQIASPEEMLQNPCGDIVKGFMGKRLQNYENLRASDIMRENVFKVSGKKMTLECLDLMNRRQVNTLIVLDDDKKYLGVVTIDDIRRHGKAGKPVGEFINSDVKVVSVHEHAKDVLEILVDAPQGYVIVKNDDDTVAGLVTKTSMVKAMAEVMWG